MDGHPTRVLGAWIGNDIDHAQPWSTTLDKIKNTLDNQTTSKPTLDVKHLIIQMVVGGMTQFLTKAQGMPTAVMTSLQQIIRNFIWDNEKTPPGLSQEQLMKPIEHGGINLLNLKARNEAIDLTWLKSYLNLSQPRPTWAYVVDAIINCIQPSGITNPSDINTFLTTLRPSGRNRRDGKQVPRPVVALLKSAKKNNLTFTPRKLSKSLKRQMPAWFHIGVPPKQYHKRQTACLREKHKVKVMRDLVRIGRRLNQHDNSHQPNQQCICRPCRENRAIGCQNPHRCALAAKNIVGNLHNKFNPWEQTRKDNLTLTHHRRGKNQRANIARGDEILFDPTITARGTLDECFRVLTNLTDTPTEPALRLQNPRLEQGQHIEPIMAYTDGSCIKNGKLDVESGSGVWFGDNHPLNRAIKVPGTLQTNQTGKIAAIVVALQTADPTAPLTIVSDSRYAIDGLTKHLRTWEDNGWTEISNKPWLEAAAYHLRRRAAPTSFKWVKGHHGTEGNEKADQLANQGARKDEPDQVDLMVPTEFRTSGIKLSTLAQRTAYQIIAHKRIPPYPRATLMNLDITRYAIKELTGYLETDNTIWKNTRHPDIRRPIQLFLYKALAGSL